jgi:hypothetical protein
MILNLEGQQNCMISKKVKTILSLFFFKKLKKKKTSNIGMWDVYPEAVDWNIALLTQISFCVSVSKEKKTLSEPKNLQNGPIYFSVFMIQLQIWLPEMKYKCASQYFSLLPLDKHPTCLCLNFFKLF